MAIHLSLVQPRSVQIAASRMSSAFRMPRLLGGLDEQVLEPQPVPPRPRRVLTNHTATPTTALVLPGQHGRRPPWARFLGNSASRKWSVSP